jgi:hypothetical protein
VPPGWNLANGAPVMGGIHHIHRSGLRPRTDLHVGVRTAYVAGATLALSVAVAPACPVELLSFLDDELVDHSFDVVDSAYQLD